MLLERVYPEKKGVFEKISLSARIVTWWKEELSEDVNMARPVNNFQYYSVALDESVDVEDTSQLAIFVRGINLLQLVELVPLK